MSLPEAERHYLPTLGGDCVWRLRRLRGGTDAEERSTVRPERLTSEGASHPEAAPTRIAPARVPAEIDCKRERPKRDVRARKDRATVGQPVYLLQIVEAEHPHKVVRMPGGGTLEREFIGACVKAIVAKGVGLGRTEAHVAQDVRDGITDVIRDLKWETVRG